MAAGFDEGVRLAAGDWVETGANLIASGNSGAGKTHLLCAVASTRARGTLGRVLKSKVARLDQVSLDAAGLAFQLGQDGEEAGGGPALLVGALGEGRPVAVELGRRSAVSMAGSAWTSTARAVAAGAVMRGPPAGHRSW